MKHLALSTLVLVLAACGTTQVAHVNEAAQVKQFATPAEGKAGLYVYRELHMFKGTTVLTAVLGGGGDTGGEKDVWVNGQCLGATGTNTVLYQQVDGNQTHAITTESGNTLNINVEAGKNYFIKQEPTAGVITSGYRLLSVSEDQAKPTVAKLKVIQSGNCSQAHPK